MESAEHTLAAAYDAFEAEDFARAGDPLASVAPLLPPDLAGAATARAACGSRWARSSG